MSDDKSKPKDNKITSMYEKLKINPNKKAPIKESNDDDDGEMGGSSDNQSTTSTLGLDELTTLTNDSSDEGSNEKTNELKITEEKLMRALADIENIRRRSEKDIANAHKYALKGFIGALLPTIDSLEKALDHAFHNKEAKEIHQGIALTMDMFIKALNQFGVEQINPINERFDPLLHEAMTMIDNKDVVADTVIEVLQKGYSLNGRLIRPARVIVTK